MAGKHIPLGEAGKGSDRRREDTAKFLDNCPFPSLLEKRKLREQKEKKK